MPGAETQLVEVVYDGLVELLQPPEDWRVEKGRLHESLGNSGQVAGVSPEDVQVTRNQFIIEPLVLVQVYLTWEKNVDNEIVIDPTAIMELADVFRDSLEPRQDPNTNELWYLQVDRLWYPNDPVGQKTRFHALVRGRGDNNAVVLRETGP